MLLHAMDGAKQGCKRILLRTVDMDVVMLAVSLANKLGCESLMVSIRVGKTSSTWTQPLRHRCWAMTSAMHCPLSTCSPCATPHPASLRDKCTAWLAWSTFSYVMPALCMFAQTPSAASINELLPTIERYIVVMYERASSGDSLNMARHCSHRKARRLKTSHLYRMPSFNTCSE